MSLISWLGLGFVALLAIGGIVALGNTSKEIYESDMDEDSKRRWGFLMGFSPLAGMYAYKKRDELFGHGEQAPEQDEGGEDTNTRT